MMRFVRVTCLMCALLMVGACSDNGGNNGNNGNNGDDDAGMSDTEMTDDSGDEDSGTGDTSEDTGGEEGDPEVAAFADDLRQSYAEAVCKSAFDCPEGQNPLLMNYLFGRSTTQQECVDEVLAAPDDWLPLNYKVSTRVDFDATAAQDCLDAIEERSIDSACDIALSTTGVPQSCLDAVGGTVQDGEACSGDAQCIDGECTGLSATDCEGTCSSRKTEGESCDDPTSSGTQCLGHLVCAVAGDASWSCEQRGSLGEGEACGQSFDSLLACGPGLFCGGEEGMETCQPVSNGAQGDDCSSGYCDAGLICNDSDVCAAPRAIGEGCTGDLFGSNCVAGAYCDRNDTTCKERKPAGQSCTFGAMCQGDLVCTEDICAEALNCSL